MKDLFKLVGAIIAIIAIIVACLLFCSLPFAFVGWGVTALIGLFTVIDPSYIDIVGVGVGTVVVVAIINAFRK